MRPLIPPIRGNGGQFIIVVPALRAVLAVTAASDVPGGAGSRGGRERFFRLLGERLFPALQARMSAETDDVAGPSGPS